MSLFPISCQRCVKGGKAKTGWKKTQSEYCHTFSTFNY